MTIDHLEITSNPHPEVRAAMLRASKGGRSALHLFPSFEAFATQKRLWMKMSRL